MNDEPHEGIQQQIDEIFETADLFSYGGTALPGPTEERAIDLLWGAYGHGRGAVIPGHEHDFPAGNFKVILGLREGFGYEVGRKPASGRRLGLSRRPGKPLGVRTDEASEDKEFDKALEAFKERRRARDRQVRDELTKLDEVARRLLKRGDKRSNSDLD